MKIESPFPDCSIYEPGEVKEIPKKAPGVYAIYNVDDNMYYLGSASDLRKRLMQRHRQFHRDSKHHSIVQALWCDWKVGKRFVFLVAFATNYHQVEREFLLKIGTANLYNKNGGSKLPKLSVEDERNFWSYVYRWPRSVCSKGCWEWQGGRAGGTRGISIGEYGKWRKWRAHRIAYLIWYGAEAFPPSLYVMHSCDNKLCVNPDHLSLGTNYDNISQYYNKTGRLKK